MSALAASFDLEVAVDSGLSLAATWPVVAQWFEYKCGAQVSASQVAQAPGSKRDGIRADFPKRSMNVPAASGPVRINSFSSFAFTVFFTYGGPYWFSLYGRDICL